MLDDHPGVDPGDDLYNLVPGVARVQRDEYAAGVCHRERGSHPLPGVRCPYANALSEPSSTKAAMRTSTKQLVEGQGDNGARLASTTAGRSGQRAAAAESKAPRTGPRFLLPNKC